MKEFQSFNPFAASPKYIYTGVGKSRSIVLSMQNTKFYLLLYIYL